MTTTLVHFDHATLGYGRRVVLPELSFDIPVGVGKNAPCATPSVLSKSSEPNETKIRTTPTNIAASPTRVTTNAFFAADAADGRSK